jgi:hypothetical protein
MVGESYNAFLFQAILIVLEPRGRLQPARMAAGLVAAVDATQLGLWRPAQPPRAGGAAGRGRL